MKVKLLHYTPLWLCSNAIRMSPDNHHLSDSKPPEIGSKDLELIHRVGNKLKHKSVLEMIVMWFEIDGISRGCLQELARHRTARLTVKSTRYVLRKELKEAKLFYNNAENTYSKDFDKFIVMTGDWFIDKHNMSMLIALQQNIQKGYTYNDKLKYMLPEAFKTKLQWQIDMRNFQNFLELRTSKDAHFEIQKLAYALYDSLPKDYQNLCAEYLQ